MKRLTFAIAVLLLSFLAFAAFAQSRTYRAGIITVERWLETLRGAPILNTGYYRQTYSGNFADAFKVNYTGSGNKLLNLQADGATVLELTKTGQLGLTGNLDVSGQVAIGSGASISSDISLRINETSTKTSGFAYGEEIWFDIDPTANGTGTFFASWIAANVKSGNAYNISSPGIVWGTYWQANHQGSGSLYALIGGRSTAWNNAGGSVDYLTGMEGIARNDEGSVVTEMKALRGEIRQKVAGGSVASAKAVKAEFDVSAGTVTDGYGFYFEDHAGAGTLTNQYGLYLENIDGGASLNYPIYSAGGDSYHAGSFGFGDSTPTEGKVTINSGTGTALAVANTLTSDTQEGITQNVSADTDGDDIYGIVQDLDTGTGTLDTGDREVFGIEQNITVAANYDSTDYWLANVQGMYNTGTVSGNWASAYGTNNFFTVSGGSSSAIGTRNTVLVSGSDIGEGNAGGIGVYNLMMSTSDANTQEVYGTQSVLLSHDTDLAYHSYATDHVSTTGGTQYGFYADLDNTNSTNYSIWVESGSGDSVVGSEMVWTPSADQVIDAVGDAILANARIVYLDPDGDYTLTSTPTIADGTKGQVLKIMCNNGEANTVTLQDQDTLGGSNLQLQAATRALTGKKVLNLVFDGTDWLEESYANN